jgi:hypothetical protein
MKATVNDLVITEHEVDIPGVCPNCGADFRSPEVNLLIHMFRTDVENGIVTSKDDEPLERSLNDFEDQGEIRGCTAYVCGKCKYVLAEGEFKDAR